MRRAIAAHGHPSAQRNLNADCWLDSHCSDSRCHGAGGDRISPHAGRYGLAYHHA